MDTEAYYFRVYRGRSGFAELASDWQALAESQASAHVHFPYWHRAYLLAREEDADAVVFVAAYLAGRLVAVFPAAYRRKSLREKLGLPLVYKALELYYPDEMGYADLLLHLDVREQKLLEAVMATLKMEPSWDIVEWLFLPSSSAFIQLLKQEPRSDVLIKTSHHSKFIPTDTDHETLMAAYGKKFLRNLRRKEKGLAQSGDYRYQWVSDGPELALAFRAFLDVEDCGWKGDGGTSILKQPPRLAYYQALFDDFSATGRLVIHLLWLGDRCLAGQFAVRAGTTLYLLKIGYDEAFAPVSPGFLLLNQTLRECCQDEDISRLSFVSGREWMDVWNPRNEIVYNAYLFNRTPKGWLLEFLMRMHQHLKPLLEKLRKG